MWKSIVFIFVGALFFGGGAAAIEETQDTSVLIINVSGLNQLGKITLEEIESGEIVSPEFDNDGVARVEHSLEQTSVFTIRGYGSTEDERLVYVDPGTTSISIYVDRNDPKNSVNISVEGSKTQSIYDRYKELTSSRDSSGSSHATRELSISDRSIIAHDVLALANEHPRSIASRDAIYRLCRAAPSWFVSSQVATDYLDFLSRHHSEWQRFRFAEEAVNGFLARAPGQKVSSYSGYSPSGTPIDLRELVGEGYVLLEFWASWCTPCLEKMPSILATQNKYEKSGFKVVFISHDSQKERWLRAIDENNLGSSVNVSTLTRNDYPLANEYAIRSLPSNILLDEKGNIVANNISGLALESVLQDLLN